MTITQAVKNFVERTANSVSSTAATDRAAIPTACNDAVANNSDVNAGNRNFNNISTNDQSPRILACSVPPGPSVQSLQAKLIKARKRNDLMRSTEKGVDEHGYPLGEFRKGFFHQYKVKVIITSTFRISLQQATTILAGFMTDQLELDLKRNRRVNEGEIMQLEADLEADEWEKIEWDKRWKTFPKKFVTALVKYHAVTLILRFYELVASKVVDKYRLNKLTMDPFVMSRRIASRIESRSPIAGKVETVRDHKIHVVGNMTSTTLWANLLPFCADYSLHQALLCYGYLKYYNFQRQRRLLAANPSDCDETDESTANGASASVLITEDDKKLAKDLGWKSLRLVTSRKVGWIFSSVGAGVGAVVWPGWGTIVFSALGDGAAGAILDDGYFKARKSLEEEQAADVARDESISRQVQ